MKKEIQLKFKLEYNIALFLDSLVKQKKYNFIPFLDTERDCVKFYV